MTSFATTLMQQLSDKHLLKHPFYQQWTDGTLAREKIQMYARQYFNHVNAFPRYLSATHSHCEDLEGRQVLLENLIDEERGQQNHPELWMQFAEAMGQTRAEVRGQPMFAETRELVETFMGYARSSYAEGLGALFAYEHQIPEIAQFKAEALCKHYDQTAGSDGVKFFDVHAQADIYHTQEISNLLEKLSDSDREKAMRAAFEASAKLWQFLDGMHAYEPAPLTAVSA
jgi:pyrroloquinoline-quinone synthase